MSKKTASCSFFFPPPHKETRDRTKIEASKGELGQRAKATIWPKRREGELMI